MIGYIRGNVSFLFTEYCFIDVHGVGYRIFIPASTRAKLVVGNTVSLFTYLHVREDAILLYGFLAQEEYDIFMHLLSVAGIGPKVALSVLSAITPGEFLAAVCHKNISVLTKISGIGRKTAERIILELKDKITSADLNRPDEEMPVYAGEQPGEDIAGQAMLALQSLGYSQAEIIPAMKKAGGNAQSVEDMIKIVLREFGRR